MYVKKTLRVSLCCLLICALCMGAVPALAVEVLPSEEGEVLFSDDFEGYEAGTVVPGSSNVYVYGTTNWSGVSEDKTMVVCDGATDNKVVKFYNTTDTTVSVDMTKSLNTAADPTDFRIDFDLKTMGNNIYCFLQEYGFLTTDVLVNLIGNKVQGQYVTTTGSKAYQDLMNYEYMQWNHFTILCDVQANQMKLFVNDEFVAEKMIYAKPPNPHVLRVIKFRADLSKGQEVYLDNVKVTRIKTSYTGTDTPGQGQDEDDGQPLTTGPSFTAPVDLGGVVRLGSAMKAAYGYDADGNPEVYFVASGSTGTFCVVDAETGKLKSSKKIPGITRAWAVAKGPDDRIYFAGTNDGKLHRYNPLTKEYEDLGVVSPTHKFLWHIVPASGSKVIIAAYASKQDGHAIEYDIGSNTYTDLGVMKEGADYVQGLYATDKYLYAGCGGNVNVQALIQYNRETGEKIELPQNTRESGGTFISRVSVANGKIFVAFSTTVYVIDEETFETVDQFKIQTAGGYYAISPPSPVNPSLIYFVAGNKVYSYNIDTKEKQEIGTVPENVMGSSHIGFDWLKLRDGRWALMWMNGEMLNSYIVPEEGVLHPVPTDFGTAEAGDFVAPTAIRCSEDDIIYISGTEGSTSAYDIKTGKILFNIPNFRQIEGLGIWKGKVYYGTYTGSAFYRYDPNKPVNYLKGDPAGNPGLIYDDNDGQDRPFVVEPAGDMLLFGTIASYGKHDGAVFVYTEDEQGNPNTKAYVGAIKNQGISGLAYKDGKIYASSTIVGGLGDDPIESQAKVAVLDAQTGEVLKEVVPDIPKVGTSSIVIGRMSFGPDGLLWAVSDKDGTIFAMDPDTLKVVKSKSLYPGASQGSKFVGHEILWGDDGTMYTTAGRKITAVNVETMESKTLYKGPRDIMYLCRDSEGNLYYQNGISLTRLPMNQRQRLRGIIETAEKVKKGDADEARWKAFTEALDKAKAITAESDIEEVKAASKAVVNAMKVLNGEEVPKEDNTPSDPQPTKKPSEGTGNSGSGSGGSSGQGGTGGTTPTTPPATGENQGEKTPAFTDMAGFEWANEAVEALAEKGVLQGKEEKRFAPGDPVTRAEFVKIVTEGFELKASTDKNPFQDIQSTDWFYRSVLAANENGIVSGVEENLFAPEEQITREMAAVILRRVCGLRGIELPQSKDDFTDYASISDYAKEAVSLLYGSGKIKGVGDGQFAPKQNLTRAEAAQLIYNIMQ